MSRFSPSLEPSKLRWTQFRDLARWRKRRDRRRRRLSWHLEFFKVQTPGYARCGVQ